MFRGFATISFHADDLSAARDWYTELLGIEPYFAFPPPPAQPAYIEFRVGDDEDELGQVGHHGEQSEERYSIKSAVLCPE